MLLLILAAFQVAGCWWTLLTGAVKSIAVKNGKRLIKGADRQLAEDTTLAGVLRGNGSS